MRPYRVSRDALSTPLLPRAGELNMLSVGEGSVLLDPL